ncbi:MAG TPA: hypothetical protein VE034_01805, partial [Burkholderiales bacterium]|nr:hypothetical protein [Burkholderiales bacterium]
AACGAQNVVVGDSGTILTSPDGITWTPRTSGVTASLKRVRCANNQFVATGLGVILTSTDGVTWTQTAPDASNFIDAAGSGTRIVVVGGPGLITSTQ